MSLLIGGFRPKDPPRYGAEHPVDVRFAPTEAERRHKSGMIIPRYANTGCYALPHLHPEYENCCALRHMAPSNAACHGDGQDSTHFAALPSVKLECPQGDPNHVIPAFCLDQCALLIVFERIEMPAHFFSVDTRKALHLFSF